MEYFEKYITHKNIKEYFNNNPDKKEMELWISFFGNITINGRRSSHIEQRIVKSEKVKVKRKKDILSDSFGEMDDLFAELSSSGSSTLFPRRNKKNIEGWTLYPQDTITRFEWNVEVIKEDDSEIDSRIIGRIKFFPDKERADMNFIKMLDYHLDKTGLLEALEEYKKIDKYLGDKYPEEFI